MNLIRRSLVLALVTTLAAGLVACSKDEEVKSALAALDSFTGDLVTRVKKAPNPSAGVDAAQKYLDTNRADLQAKLAGIKTLRGFQVSEEMRKKLEAGFMSNATAVASLQLDYVGQAALDKDFSARLEKLVNDYKNVVTE
jgi:hypothetical protein